MGTFDVYRGLTLAPGEIAKEFKEGKEVRLKNFTSTSRERDVAMRFATENKKEGKEPVLMKYHLENETGRYYFSMD